MCTEKTKPVNCFGKIIAKHILTFHCDKNVLLALYHLSQLSSYLALQEKNLNLSVVDLY